MKKTLSEYLKIGSETEIPTFPIANHELRSLLDRLETSSKPTFKHNLITHKGKIIMGIIGLSFIATLISLGISYFSPNAENQTISSYQANNNSISSNFEDRVSKNQANTTEKKNNLSSIKEKTNNSSIADNNIIGSKASGKENANSTANAPKLRIAGIEKLILTQEEMEKIGIKFKDGKYFIEYEELYDKKELPEQMREVFLTKLKSLEYDISPNKILIKCINTISYVPNSDFDIISSVSSGFFNITLALKKYSGWDNSIYSKTMPVSINAITLTYNPKSNKFETNANTASINDHSPLLDTIIPSPINLGDYNDFFKTRTKSFLPVHFTLEDKEHQMNSEIDVWFCVNKEFAELLPDRYRMPILKELELMTGIQDGKITPEDACEALNGRQSYLDLCHQSGNDITDASIFPNPATDGQFELKFALKESSKIRIDVYEVSGNFLKSLKEFTKYKSGLNSEKFSTQGLNQGVYLVAITNDRGEQIIRKLLIK